MKIKALLASTLVLSACSQATSDGPIATSSGGQSSCTTRTGLPIGGPFELVNQDGETVTEQDFKDQHTLVFFGFTNCPDVCPFTLYSLGQAIDLLPEGIDPPTTMLVSIDAEADTPETLKAYLSNDAFPDDSVGLIGSNDQLKAMAGAFKASFGRVDDPDSRLGYTMDHTSLIYLMNEDWELDTFFTGSQMPEEIATCLGEFLK